jgi:hypothetical protein
LASTFLELISNAATASLFSVISAAVCLNSTGARRHFIRVAAGRQSRQRCGDAPLAVVEIAALKTETHDICDKAS